MMRWPIISRTLRFSPVTSPTRSHELNIALYSASGRGMVEIPSVSGGTPGASERPIASWENSANDDASSMEVRNATEVIPYKLRSVREDSMDFYQRDPALSDMLVADPDLEYLTNGVERIEGEVTNDQKNPLNQRAIATEPVANVSRGGEFGDDHGSTTKPTIDGHAFHVMLLFFVNLIDTVTSSSRTLVITLPPLTWSNLGRQF
ncbi:hypothetical protein B0J14DRAFT_566678 [Halenospora varia]|nr:hypothetical protein B0J14DRAFT_566678 [Halenospora varia]